MGRGSDWSEQKADEGACYDKLIEINLDELHALAACPHNPDVIDTVKNLSGKKVTQVVIGSCTNSSLDDLESVAAIVKGKHIAPGVEAGIAPGSRTTLLMASKAGILEDLIEAGFRILESACGPCIGQGFAPNSEGVTLRTFNRNFKGRSGTADANVYLVSPETAAAAAVTGVFTEAETLSYEDPAYKTGVRISMLDGNDPRLSSPMVLNCATNRAMVIPPLPESEASKVEILRGPNIKPCPACREYKSNLSLPVRLKASDNVSTDDIMPAGAKVLPLRSNIPEISKFTLTRLDETFYTRSEEAKFADCCVVGGENYGQGSSREHAALGPMYLGVRAVITKSFARIHKANLINYGIIPMTFANSEDYDKIKQGDTLELKDLDDSLKNHKPFKVLINGKTEIECVNDIAARSAQIIMAGGLAAYTRKGGN